MTAEALKGHLDGLLLAVLERGPAHGYSLMEALRTGSGGTFHLPTGTVYPALRRLETAGFVASTWSQGDGRQRRVYELTDAGRRALAQQRLSWHQFRGAVNAVMDGGEVAWTPST